MSYSSEITHSVREEPGSSGAAGCHEPRDDMDKVFHRGRGEGAAGNRMKDQ